MTRRQLPIGDSKTDREQLIDESTPIDGDESNGKLPLSRRTTLLSLVGAGGLLSMTQSALASNHQSSGQHRGQEWQRDVSAGGNMLIQLGALEMDSNPAIITDLAGSNLLIDNDGILGVEDGPGSGLDADTLQGLDKGQLIARIEELEAEVAENRAFIVGIVETVNDALLEIEDFANNGLNEVESTLNDGFSGFEDNVNAVGNEIESTFNSLVANIQTVLDYLADESDGVEETFNSAVDQIETTGNDIIEFVNGPLDGAMDIVDTVTDELDNILSGIEDGINSFIYDAETLVRDIVRSTMNLIPGVDPIDFPFEINFPTVDFQIDLSSVDWTSVEIPELTLPRLDIPTVTLPTINILELSMPTVDFPSLSLPKLDGPED